MPEVGDLVLHTDQNIRGMGGFLVVVAVGLEVWSVMSPRLHDWRVAAIDGFILLVGLLGLLKVEKCVFWKNARVVDFYKGIGPFLRKTKVVGFDDIHGLQLNCRKKTMNSGSSTIMLRVELVLAPDDCPMVYVEYDKAQHLEEVGRKVSAVIGLPLVFSDNYNRFLGGARSGFTFLRKNDRWPWDPGT